MSKKKRKTTKKTRIRRTNGGGKTNHFGVFGDREEIQRPYQLDGLARIGEDFFPACHTEGVMHVERGADQPGIEGNLRVEMQISEKHLVRIIAPDKPRILRAALRVACTSGDRTLKCRKRSPDEA